MDTSSPGHTARAATTTPAVVAATSPLRHAADQGLLDDLEDAALNLRLDLEELRSTTLTFRDNNLAWVSQIAEEVTLILMSHAPFHVHQQQQSAPGSSSVRSVSSAQVSPRALGAAPPPTATLGSSIHAVPHSSSAALVVPQVHSGASSSSHQRKGTNASPPLNGVHDVAAAMPTPAARVLPQLKLPITVRLDAPPPLTARKLKVRPLGAHTEMVAPLSVEERQHAAEQALRLATESGTPTRRHASPTATGGGEDTVDRGAMALITPVRSVPPSREGATDGQRAAMRLSTTTFGELDNPGKASSVLQPTAPPGSRQGTRRTARLADPTDARLTAEGQHDLELLHELELQRSTRSQQQAGTTNLGDVNNAFNRTMPRAGTTKLATHGLSAEGTWVVPTAGHNYKEPFLANLISLTVAPSASYVAPAASTLISTGGAADAQTQQNVVVAVPSAPQHQGPAAGEHKRFQSYYGRRLRHQPPFDAAGVAFGASPHQPAPRTPLTARDDQPKLRIVMTRL